MRAKAYGQAVWFWLPDAGVKFAEIIGERWWLTSPAHQEERGAAVKPLRRECRSDFGVPVLACVRLFVLHARQWVRRAPGIPCALSIEGATLMHHPDAKLAPRRRTAMCSTVAGASSNGEATVLEMLKLLAPRAGFEPATIRLTVECSTAELPRNKATQIVRERA